MNSKNPLVSIVITTKNEAANIENCLWSISEQAYSNIEVIVIDNNSSDETKALAKRFTDKVFDKGPERSAQRNYGMLEIAQGEVLAYIDADMILGPKVVSESVALIQQGAVGVYVPETVLGSRPVSRIRRFERYFYDSTVIDAVRFIDAGAFREVGGFDEVRFESGSGEDWDLDQSLSRVGRFASIARNRCVQASDDWKLWSVCTTLGVPPKDAAAIYHNEADIEVVEYLRKKTYYATGFGGYVEKWGKTDPAIAKQLSASYRLVGVFVERGKWKRVLRRPDLFAGVLGLRVLVGLAYLKSKSL